MINEILVRRLSEQAPLARYSDATERYGSKIWGVLTLEGEWGALVYSRSRQRFEVAGYTEWLRNWLDGKLDTSDQPVDILRDSKTILGGYGLFVGAWYLYEHSKYRLVDQITTAAEFIYFNVPYSGYIPGLERLAGWGPLE